MKKIIVVYGIIVFSVICSSFAYAVTITDDFTGYTVDQTLIGEGHGEGWGGNWTSSETFDGTWTCVTGPKAKLADISSSNQFVYRTFSSIINSDTGPITISLKYDIVGAPIDAVFPYVTLVNDGGPLNPKLGPEIYYTRRFSPSDLTLYAIQYEGGDLTLKTFGETTDANATITISNVNFTDHTYTVQVNTDSAITGVKFGNSDCENFNAFAAGIAPGNFSEVYIDDISIQSVPEPSSIAFFGMGFLGLIGGWIRKRTVSSKL